MSSAARSQDCVHPAKSKWSFREIFAGTGHLTRTFKNRGHFTVKEPFELMFRGRAQSSQDILNDSVFDKLCREASKPRQLWRFGFPCGSFSILQNLNHGTRSQQQPMGNGSLRREKLGNEIMLRTTHLCHLLHKHGSFFTLENPKTSWAWKTPAMKQLMATCNCAVVSFDQCRFGLQIPGLSGKLGLARKPTTMVGTLPNLRHLARTCDHTHEHAAVIGSVKHKGVWQKRSTLAGSYPHQLCTAYARSFERCFA